MTRDMDLIRKMVLAMEDAPGGSAPAFDFDGYTPEQIGYHAHLMFQAGLAAGDDLTNTDSVAPLASLRFLTWEGHEFAAASRDESRWKTAMDTVKQKGGTITIGVLTQLLTELMKSEFGLH
jgi:uncharacterized protein DUF2513